MSYEQLQSLREQGINAILNLCAEFCDLHSIEESQDFEVYYLPVPDEEAPELAEMERALEWLDEAIYLGKRVLIHCRHGIGRTGTLLNAYLLRRGLGHRLAGKKLKGFRSKPSNFDQWWTIRKYGRNSKRLTVREPSLEFKHIVDLQPFFEDYAAFVAAVEEHVLNAGATPPCGNGIAGCCQTTVHLQLVEAVHLNQRMNVHLSSKQRLELIERAVESSRLERQAQAELQAAGVDDSSAYCLSRVGAACPLLEDSHCLLFAHRPLQCRTFALTVRDKELLWSERIAPVLEQLSRQLFVAFLSRFPGGEMPVFPLAEVVSGRYVQRFFHYMLQNSQADGSSTG
jgi:Fe-S-cluster containining protein